MSNIQQSALHVNLPTPPSLIPRLSQSSSLDLNQNTNKTHLHIVTHGNNHVDVICLATGDTKHLYHAYSGCIRFKSLVDVI